MNAETSILLLVLFVIVSWYFFKNVIRPNWPDLVIFRLFLFAKNGFTRPERGPGSVNEPGDSVMRSLGRTSGEGFNSFTKAYRFFLSFDGRIARGTFFVLQLIGGFLLIFAFTTLFLSATETPRNDIFYLFPWIALPLGLWIDFSSCARRFRDLGITAWSTVLIFIPALNIAIFAMLLFAPTGTVKRILEKPTV